MSKRWTVVVAKRSTPRSRDWADVETRGPYGFEDAVRMRAELIVTYAEDARYGIRIVVL